MPKMRKAGRISLRKYPINYNKEGSMDLSSYLNELRDLFITLCKIPAPTEHEDERAGFIANWYAENGLMNFEIDNAGNVLYYFGVKSYNPVHIITAHMDTVFSASVPLNPRIENDVLYCPGSGDNTANLAIMMLCVKYLSEIGYEGSTGLIFAADICEEGLGNLKGVNEILNEYGARIEQLVSVDLAYGTIIAQAVGSKRYEISISSKGGHAFHDFGNPNAIAVASKLISSLYSQPLPEEGVATYNVGQISGGTGVNVIAQNASFLYEFRSINADLINMLDDNLSLALIEHREENVNIECRLLGERPCQGNVNSDKQQFLLDRIKNAYAQSGWAEAGYGNEITVIPGSTDCNASLARGIPSACFGLAYSEGHHTLNEFTRLDSLIPGLETLINFILDERL